MDNPGTALPTWIVLTGFLAAAFTAAATGAFFKPGAWYRTLRKPAWTPPDWLFPVAWTVLYVAMAVAAWRVALASSALVPAALALWAWQLVLNALWSPVFFGLRRLGGGMAVIAFLWIAVALSTWTFWQVDRVAGWLMAPYLGWVTIAAALNLSVWRMNRDPASAPARA